MNKTSTARLLTYYLWLADTIRRRGPLSRQRINELWSRSSINDEDEREIPESTFHRWKDAIQTLFDITIRCDANGEYYIEDAQDIQTNAISNWLLNSFSVSNLLHGSQDLRDKILVESIPSGEKFLAPVMEALRDQFAIRITYQGFSKPQPAVFIVEPYCLKVFKLRWYMLAYSTDMDEIRVYALDRIHAVEPTNRKYAIPDNSVAEKYFRDSYGVTVLEGEPEHVIISISEDQAPYLRSLPLHPSQKEIEPHDGYPTFSFYLYPAEEFQRELRAYGSDVEVLSPQWLRDEFAKDASNLKRIYSPDHE